MQLTLIKSDLRERFENSVINGYKKDFGSFVLETYLNESKLRIENKKIK